jgi:hypothetical protein
MRQWRSLRNCLSCRHSGGSPLGNREGCERELGTNVGSLPSELRSVATAEHFGFAAKLAPDVDAVLKPWTTLGHPAARSRPRHSDSVCVTEATRRHPAVTAQVRRVEKSHVAAAELCKP